MMEQRIAYWAQRSAELDREELFLRARVEGCRAEVARLEMELEALGARRLAEKAQHDAELARMNPPPPAQAPPERVDLEVVFQKALEQLLGGTHMRIPNCGVSDITTDRCHAEIKEIRGWKGAIGQLVSYKTAVPREELHLYLYKKSFAKRLILDEPMCDTIVQTCDNLGIDPFFVDQDPVSNKLVVYNLRTKERFEHAHIEVVPVRVDEAAPEPVRTETGRFPCPACYKSFSYNWVLKRHLEVCNGKQSRFECIDCRKSFETSRRLHYHRHAGKCPNMPQAVL